MPHPRRKEYNTVDAASLARWMVLAAFLAATGLIYVYLTVQLNHLGTQKKALETELVAVRVDNIEVEGQVTALTSHLALQRRLKEGHLKMISIAERNIVRLSAPLGLAAEDAVQPVVNQRAGR